ncbi:MAG: hypothetical protein ACD_39C00905G0001 [uncultured bacterium]|nr:MAG: hypothetical protein ACD_39C00905G0001 [uncultured bacterium]
MQKKSSFTGQRVFFGSLQLFDIFSKLIAASFEGLQKALFFVANYSNYMISVLFDFRIIAHYFGNGRHDLMQEWLILAKIAVAKP